ncbi:MAG: hypothetical protein IKQ80_13220 [Clostridia bacterium]|nr:hypothetical protein [Clostridia bacterium]
MRRVLAFFGAFNPPTAAHVDLARFAMEKTGREGVMFVPSKSAYIQGEQGKDYAYSDAVRLKMLKILSGNRPWMDVTDCELTAERQPFTYETLCRLREGGLDPALLLGSDKLPELEHGWLHVEEIAHEFGIVCLTRGKDACDAMIAGDPYLRALSPYIRVLETPQDTRDVSSTRVRELMSQIQALKRQVIELVPGDILAML